MFDNINVVSIRAVEDLALKAAGVSATHSNQDDLGFYISKSTVTPNELHKAINARLKARDQEQVQIAAEVVIGIMDQAQCNIESMVSKVRAVRRSEANLVHQIKQLDMAKTYGSETSNYIPLLILLGHMKIEEVENPSLAIIPEGWVPASAKKSTARTSKVKAANSNQAA